MGNRYILLPSVLVSGFIVLWAPLTLSQAGPTAKPKTTGQPQFLNPDGLSKPTGYSHVVITQPGKFIYVSGQVALNAGGEVVGKGDLRAQATQAMENLKMALAAAGAMPSDIIKVNHYVVNLKPDLLPIIREVRSKFFSAENPPASTLVGVTALAREEFMIEIEAVAVAK